MLDLNIENDPYSLAEYHLLSLTEEIVKIHGQYKGRHKLCCWVLEWCADKKD